MATATAIGAAAGAWARTSCVSRSTSTVATPGTRVTSSVTATVQWSQVMPATRYVSAGGVAVGEWSMWEGSLRSTQWYTRGVSGLSRILHPLGVPATVRLPTLLIRGLTRGGYSGRHGRDDDRD